MIRLVIVIVRSVSGYLSNFVCFPSDESASNRKLSRQWHGPYRVKFQPEPDVCITKIYFPQDTEIRVHQPRVKSCPPEFPSRFLWYGGRRSGPGCPPKWVGKLLGEHLKEDSFSTLSESTDNDYIPESESLTGDSEHLILKLMTT